MITTETPSSRLFLGVIPWYGLLIVLGMGLAIMIADREANRQGLPKDTIIDLALRILPCGILGARIYYVLFSWNTFQNDLVSILRICEGGLAIYGGLIAGFCTAWIFCRRRKISFPQMLDLIMPGVALAQALGRWGNYFNQEAYGAAIDPKSPFCFFPLAVRIQEGGGFSWHLATFFYESLLDSAIFLFLLWAGRHLKRRKGDIFLFYALLYSAGRMVIENLRMDSLYLGSAIRVSQLVSLIMGLTVLGIYAVRRAQRNDFHPIHWILSAAVCVTGIICLGFCLTGSFPWEANLAEQTGFLLVHMTIQICAGFFLYGRGREK